MVRFRPPADAVPIARSESRADLAAATMRAAPRRPSSNSGALFRARSISGGASSISGARATCGGDGLNSNGEVTALNGEPPGDAGSDDAPNGPPNGPCGSARVCACVCARVRV